MALVLGLLYKQYLVRFWQVQDGALFGPPDAFPVGNPLQLRRAGGSPVVETSVLGKRCAEGSLC